MTEPSPQQRGAEALFAPATFALNHRRCFSRFLVVGAVVRLPFGLAPYEVHGVAYLVASTRASLADSSPQRQLNGEETIAAASSLDPSASLNPSIARFRIARS